MPLFSHETVTPGPLKGVFHTEDPGLERYLRAAQEFDLKDPTRHQIESMLYLYLYRKAQREVEVLKAKKGALTEDGNS